MHPLLDWEKRSGDCGAVRERWVATPYRALVELAGATALTAVCLLRRSSRRWRSAERQTHSTSSIPRAAPSLAVNLPTLPQRELSAAGLLAAALGTRPSHRATRSRWRCKNA
jgi:hypothetical protein